MNTRGVAVLAILAFLSAASASKTCLKTMDVALVIEDSGALPDTDSETQLKQFLAKIVNHLNLGVNDAHVALQLYNDQSRTAFNLNNFTETTDAKGAILLTRFTRKTVDAPSIGSALRFTYDSLLTVQNGERSCFPTVVILVSYSSATDPNGNGNGDQDISIARQLRNAGALILTVGVGPNRNPSLLIDIAGSTQNYYDVNAFSDLDGIADDIANITCEYKFTGDFYPCEMETIQADLVFVVDVSRNMNGSFVQAVTQFIRNYLRPYTFGKNGIQAALVTYSKVADVAIGLTAARSYNDFLQKVQSALADGPSGTERYVYNALDTVRYHILANARPTATRSIFVFATDCFTGPDPTETAKAIRETPANLYVVSLGAPFGFWKETLDIAGDAQHVYEVPQSPEIILPNFLPRVAWRALCSGNPAIRTTTPQPATTTAQARTTTGHTTTTAAVTTTPAVTTTQAPPEDTTTEAVTTSEAAPTTTEAAPTTTEAPLTPEVGTTTEFIPTTTEDLLQTTTAGDLATTTEEEQQ